MKLDKFNNTSQESLEQRLRKTLSFYLAKLPDNESRDFMIQLIIRDYKQELLDIVLSFYYGEDLLDPDVMAFYKDLHNDILNNLK